MKRALKLAVACMPWMLGAHAATPVKVALPGKVTGFAVFSMEFSSNGEQLCIAGADQDDKGGMRGRMVLIDRARGALVWQQSFAAPDGNAVLAPVQCRVTGSGVYLLADADGGTDSKDKRTSGYVYSFDARSGKPTYKLLDIPAHESNGYALDVGEDGVIKVSGYLKDQDERFNYYSTYSATLDAALRMQGEPLVRKSGAYVDMVGARIVGDSTYLTGMFAPAKSARTAPLNDFAASRLRLNGSYAWSAHPQFDTRHGAFTAVGEDGAAYAIRYAGATTSLLAIPPNGKPLPPRSYTSPYCETESMASHGKGLLAVRHVCGAGGAGVLVALDPATGKESPLDWVPAVPRHVATAGGQWAVLAQDKGGQLAVYFGN